MDAALGKPEVQVVKAELSAMRRQVIDVDGFNMEGEIRLRVRGAARRWAVMAERYPPSPME